LARPTPDITVPAVLIARAFDACPNQC